MGWRWTPRHGEIGVAAGLGLVAVYVIVGAARMPAGTVALPGPAFFPLALALLLGGTAVALLVRAVRGEGGAAASVEVGDPHVLTVLGGLLGVALLLERLGFLATLSLFLLVLFRALSPLGWLRAAAAAVATAVVAALFFERLLGVNLPRGPW